MKRVKGILIALGCLILVTGFLVIVKGWQFKSMAAGKEAFVPPPETVTATQVRSFEWESVLTAVGSLQAVQGVIVTAELTGRVTKIAFESGTKVEAGQLLVQQDISAELADRSAAQSQLELARKNYERSKTLLPHNAISKSAFDDAKALYEKAEAQLGGISAAIAKKTIKAPFAGRLGIREVNLGEILKSGQPIVSLQSLDPIYVNFLLPQEALTGLKKGLRVRLTTDALEGAQVQGVISAVNAEVESTSRNIRVQATLGNPRETLRPGMYVNVSVVLPSKKAVLAIPASAVHYAPYSDSVFVVEDKEGGAGKAVRQQFVRLGEKHGDFVAVLSGLTPADRVVSTGVFKLRSGQSVIVDNTLEPKFELEPRPDSS